MSDPAVPNGNGDGRINRAAENALLKLVARIFMVAVLPVGLGIGAMVWSKVDKTNESTIRLEQSVKFMIEQQIPTLTNSVNTRFADQASSQAERDRGQDRRIEKIEDRLTSRGNP